MENGQSVFFSLASHALRACEARAVRARKTLTPRVTDFFSDFEEKTDCFAVYASRCLNTLSNIASISLAFEFNTIQI